MICHSIYYDIETDDPDVVRRCCANCSYEILTNFSGSIHKTLDWGDQPKEGITHCFSTQIEPDDLVLTMRME